MAPNATPPFNIDALRKDVSARVFERGEEYFLAGRVRLLSNSDGRAVGWVAGTENYRTEVVARGTRVGSWCTCPAGEDGIDCRHVIAVALAANAALEDQGELAALRARLAAMAPSELVDLILNLADSDPSLLDRITGKDEDLNGDESSEDSVVP